MATNDEIRISAIKEMDDRFQRLTGREALGYIAQPMMKQWRIAFGDGTVCTSPKDAQDYMASLIWLAEFQPDKLPYPFDQELTPEQDLRVINGWGKPTRGDRLRRIERCEAEARRGTGTCNQPLDSHGQCPRAGEHIER